MDLAIVAAQTRKREDIDTAEAQIRVALFYNGRLFRKRD